MEGGRVSYELNGVTVYERLLTRTDNRPDEPFAGGVADYITVHETGNTAPGATAEMTANWVNNGSPGGSGPQQLSFHMVTDDDEAYQLLRLSEQGWHAGDGGGQGNRNSLGLEICVNKTGAARHKALDNGARIVAGWLDKGYGKRGIVQHNHWSGKDCPMYLRRGEPYGWDEFLDKVEGYRARNQGQGDGMADDKMAAQVAALADRVNRAENLIAGHGIRVDGKLLTGQAALEYLDGHQVSTMEFVYRLNAAVRDTREVLEELEQADGDGLDRDRISLLLRDIAATVGGDE